MSNYPLPQRLILSAVVRYRGERKELVRLTSDDLGRLISSAPIPDSPLTALENLLVYLASRQPNFSEHVRLPAHLFPITVAGNEADFRYIFTYSATLGYTEVQSSMPDAIRLTLKGWTRAEELRRSQHDSRRVFAAMPFSDQVLAVWTEGIEPAIRDAGLEPVRMDQLQHNDRIDARMLLEIRRSALVVADVTEQNPGVYFEAGYALGIPVPVIWTCRKDAIERVHFDTRQYNHIVWDTPDQLRQVLTPRIQVSLIESRAQGRKPSPDTINP